MTATHHLARPSLLPCACPVCSGLGYVHVERIAIDACPGCTMLGELLWRDHLREVEAARLLSRKPRVERGKEAG